MWMRSAIDQNSGFFRSFTGVARELRMNIAITYLEVWHPKARNSVSILNSSGDAVLNYSKVCICDFDADGENAAGCDVNCGPGESFDVCTLMGSEGEVKVGAMICADREFPEPATRLMLKGAELIVIPNACHWDELRTAGLLTRAFDNLLGVAMVNYPRPRNNGNSRAYSCVAWRDGKSLSPLVAVAGEQEELLLAVFDLDGIREFRRSEAWRLQYREYLPSAKSGDKCIWNSATETWERRKRLPEGSKGEEIDCEPNQYSVQQHTSNCSARPSSQSDSPAGSVFSSFIYGSRIPSTGNAAGRRAGVISALAGQSEGS
jgi:predicted amidohydrolase